MPDVLANLGALELILTMAVCLGMALMVRKGPSYWPALRILLLTMGMQGLYYVILRVLYYQQTTEHFIEIAQMPFWRGLYFTFKIGGILWVFWIVFRTNQLGKEVDLLGRDGEPHKVTAGENAGRDE